MNKVYAHAQFWRANKEYYGIFDSGQTVWDILV